MRVIILGCGGSGGTPVVDKRGWGGCDRQNPRNRRLRPSIIVENANSRILVDTSPDLRQQLLNADVNSLDGVVYTHPHADHLHGIDDLRAINRVTDKPLDIYANNEVITLIHKRFAYVFEPLAKGSTHYYKPVLVPHEIKSGDKFTVGDINICAFEQDHGYCKTLGLRFDNIAYSTDVVDMPDASFAALAGLDVWIVDTLSDKPHPTHAHVGKVLEWVRRIKPKRTILTHMDVLLDYAELNSRLPPGVEAAYDMMVIEP